MSWRIERVGILAMVALLVLFVLITPQTLATTADGEADDSLAADGGDSAESATEEEAATQPPPSKSQKKLEVHGFLTQGYATSSYLDVPEGTASPTFQEVTFGIPEEGTFKYRVLALQFRYQITPDDLMVIQLSSEEAGNSPIVAAKDDIELDWAFYERRITDTLRLRVGRVRIPVGIYNEIRDVGTVLPFYRPPASFYDDGASNTETLDGLLLDKSFLPASSWNFDLSLYGGESEVLQLDAFDPSIGSIARIEDAYGAQLWLNTPVSGLRVGFNLTSRRFTGGLWHTPGGLWYDPQEGDSPPRLTDYGVSIDASFTRFVFRAEYQDADFVIYMPLGAIDLQPHRYYGQVGVLPTLKFNIWLQYEVSNTKPISDFYVGGKGAERTLREDLGISFNYLFAPNVVLKAEYHEYEENAGMMFPVPSPDSPFGFFMQEDKLNQPNGKYSILSLSVSF